MVRVTNHRATQASGWYVSRRWIMDGSVEARGGLRPSSSPQRSGPQVAAEPVLESDHRRDHRSKIFVRTTIY
jgi:hypothetical protein